MGPLRNMLSQLAVPMRRKGKVIGALNLLSETTGAFTSQDEALLRQFAAHVAVAIENARLFKSERQYVDTLETLAEIGREMSSILDLDVLLTRIASLTKRLIDYRTFGILLVNEATHELDIKLAVRYGEEATSKHVKIGEGLVGWAALHKEALLVSDVSKDPRYLNLVPDARSELVVPMLIKDRCIGVFDLESPELSAFTKEHKELLTLLAAQAAVAIENARLYEEVRRNEERIEKELRFAQRVQEALLPTELPVRLRQADVAGRFASARELGGDLHDFLSPEPNSLVVAVGDVSGKGAPAALYGAFAAELVRSRTLRRRYNPDRFSVGGVLGSMNTILHERQLEEYYCTLCYAFFDFKRRALTMANSGLPYPIRCSGDECGQIELPGVPLGSFPNVTYDEVTIPLQIGDVFVFCTDGIFETMNEEGTELGAQAGVRDRSRAPQGDRAGDRRCDLRHDDRVPRSCAAERRHDRGRGKNHRLAFDLAVLFADVKAHRPAAEDGHLVDLALDLDARALGGRATRLRQHRDRAAAVVDAVHLERAPAESPSCW